MSGIGVVILFIIGMLVARQFGKWDGYDQGYYDRVDLCDEYGCHHNHKEDDPHRKYRIAG